MDSKLPPLSPIFTLVASSTAIISPFQSILEPLTVYSVSQILALPSICSVRTLAQILSLSLRPVESAPWPWLYLIYLNQASCCCLIVSKIQLGCLTSWRTICAVTASRPNSLAFKVDHNLPTFFPQQALRDFTSLRSKFADESKYLNREEKVKAALLIFDPWAGGRGWLLNPNGCGTEDPLRFTHLRL